MPSHTERALSRSARLIALLHALRCRRHAVTAAALARELQVSERTIYRDLSELAAQGAPVQGEAGVGYILRPGLFLPPLMLTDASLQCLAHVISARPLSFSTTSTFGRSLEFTQ